MIDSFEGEYAFLSNFHPAVVIYEDIQFPSVEHAYQAAKTNDLTERLRICQLPTAGQAKRMGGKVKLHPDWSKRKIGVMNDLLEQKFKHPELRAKLMATDGHDLVEGNYWGDIFWGIYNGKGKNHLGRLLMSIRSSINMGLS